MSTRITKDGKFDKRYKNEFDGNHDHLQMIRWQKLLAINIISFFVLNFFITKFENFILIFGIVLITSFLIFLKKEHKRGAITKPTLILWLILVAIGVLIIVFGAFPNLLAEDPDPRIIPGKILIDGVYY